jgi:hypothetical protein
MTDTAGRVPTTGTGVRQESTRGVRRESTRDAGHPSGRGAS